MWRSLFVLAGLATGCAAAPCEPAVAALPDGTRWQVAPGPAVEGIDDAVYVAAGSRHACAVTRDGDTLCWLPGAAPTRVEGLAAVKRLAAGKYRFCALDASGAVWCFAAGQPAAQVQGITRATSLAMSHELDIGCAAGEGALWCFGDDGFAALGATEARSWRRAVRRQGAPNVVGVALAKSHACTRHGSGEVRCWGPGYGGDELVPGLAAVASVAAGDGVGCALSAGAVRCWGRPGAVGDGSRVEPDGWLAQPRLLTELGGTRSLSLGRASCALLLDGTARCWGVDHHGAVGDGTLAPRYRPVPVCGLRDAVALSVGEHACAALRDGTVRCWGYPILDTKIE